MVVGILLSVGCYYITNNQIPTTYKPKLFLCFFILIFLFSKQQNNKTTRQPLLYIDIESACSDALLIIYCAERELIMRIAECVTIDTIGRSLCFL